MKTSIILFFTLCLLWLFSTACTKEDITEIAPASKKTPDLQEPANLHQRSINITDANGKQNATLRFVSTSKKLLDNMPLNDNSFGIQPPQTLVPVRFCKNTRPGSIIPERTCGECADYVLKRVCVGNICRYQYVRVSDWEKECWDQLEH